MEYVILQHTEHLPAGALGEILEQRRRPVRTVRLWEGEPVPAFSAGGLRGLVVLGSLRPVDAVARDAERALLGACVEAEVPVLGIGLGAQLLAEATGGGCVPGAGAIGYVPLTRTGEAADDPVFAPYPDGMPALMLDPDALAPARSAVVLARSADGAVAAFRVGQSAYGIGFHAQLDASLVAGLVTALDFPGLDALVAQAQRRAPFHLGMGAALLGRWVDAVVGRTPEEQPWGRRGPQPVPAAGLTLHPA
jgi:GMP synthase-like glutamine amidotransferase